MCSVSWILLVLPCIVLASDPEGIEIYIDVKGKYAEVTHNEHLIGVPDYEASSWGLDPFHIWQAVSSYDTSQQISMVNYAGYLNLLKRDIIASVRVESVIREPDINVQKTSTNMVNENMRFHYHVEEETKQTVSSFWNVSDHLTPLPMKLNVNLQEGEQMSITPEWNKDNINTRNSIVRLQFGQFVKIPVGHTAVANISISRGTMEVRVHYNATLRGRVPVKISKLEYKFFNGEPYKELHEFVEHYDVNELLSHVGWPTEITGTELIRIKFVSDIRINVTDETTGEVMYTGAAVLIRNSKRLNYRPNLIIISSMGPTK